MPLPISDVSNPDVIKFLIESYERTDRLRARWNLLHGARMTTAATLQREAKGYFDTDIFKASMANGLPTITRDHVNAGRYRKVTPIRDALFVPTTAHLRKGHTLTEVGLGDVKDDPRLDRPDSDLKPDPVMRPIDPKQKEVLYKELPFFGRQRYLNIRNKILPEQRYYLRLTGGWEYGWRLRDSYFGKQQPSYGRVCRLTKDVLSKTGPQPDPPHYMSTEEPGGTKCLKM